MNISSEGIALIKEFEGLSLTAYPDPGTGGEPWTIGYGHTGGVKEGDVITQDQADEFLRKDIRNFEKCVNTYVNVPITQSQFDALVAFCFNVGCGNFKKSTLLAKLNAEDDVGAADEFLRWNRAGGKVMAGLTRRREAERALFLS